MKPGIIAISTAIVVMMAACKRDIAPAVVKCAGDRLKPKLDDCWYVEDINNTSVIESPTSNPNKPMEFAFIENKALVKYDMETGEKSTLVSGLNLIQSPDWGKSGWIVFSAGWKIWKIHEGGTGLEQISFNPKDLHPKFDPTGLKIAYPTDFEFTGNELQNNPELVYRNKVMIIDLNGQLLDSICVDNGVQCKTWWYSGWTMDNTIFHPDGTNKNGSVTEYGISLYNTTTKNNSDLIITTKHDKDGVIDDIEFDHTSGLVFFKDEFGIRFFDPDKGKIKKFRTSCDSEYYGDFTITSDGKHIIAVKTESSANKETCERSIDYSFVKMKTDGSKEEVIDMP